MQRPVYDEFSPPARDSGAGAEVSLPPPGSHPQPPSSHDGSPEASEQARILALLREVSQDLASILDFDHLLRASGERVRRLVNYDIFSVLLLNPETGRLEHAFSLRYNERIQLRTSLGLGEGLCGTAALERKPVRVNAVELDPRYIRCEMGLAVRSELVVPLIAKDRLLGVLDLESLEPDAFTEGHELMLVTLASTLAIALENARLYAELKHAKQRMARDLERAREVQRALLPSDPPNIRGLEIATRCQPALEIGGDFYDLLPYGDGRLAIAVGDVVGKGSAAALLAALGIGLLREHAAQHPCEPEEMLLEINRHLQLALVNGQFVTLAFAVYDAARREICIANAGFPLPVLVRNGTATPLAVRGVPLGLFTTSAYEPLRLQLQVGDVIAFCSDGIHEQANDSGEEFGVPRLLSHLARTKDGHSAEKIADGILDAALQHAGELAGCNECRDDRTVVVLRVRENG
jgi:sigma-B regulation protein RsbU (phosphoserine phosphatase)